MSTSNTSGESVEPRDSGPTPGNREGSRPGFALGAVLLLLGLAGASAAVADQRVLVLHSFSRGVEPYTIFSSAFREELVRSSPEAIEFHEIPLETALFEEMQSEGFLVEYLVSFANQRPLDLVVTVGAPALGFVERHREVVGTSTPLLIAGVDERRVAFATLTASDAVVPVRIEFRGAVETILRLRPETRHLMVVLGRSPLERQWAPVLRRELEPYAERLEFTFVDELPFEEIRRRAAALPDDSAILHCLMVLDAAGRSFEQELALIELRAAANVPIFGLFGHQLGQGVVGGRLLPIEGAAREAARAALRILSGEAPSSVRLAPVGPGPPEFDWNELERFGIGPERLPPGSTIRFRRTTLWGSYKWQVLGVGAVCLTQMALILLLFRSRIRRRRTERELLESREQYALAIEGATDGIWDWNLNTDEVFLSPRGRVILGYGEREPAREVASWDERVHPQDRRQAGEALSAHLEGLTEVYRVEFRLRDEGDAPRYILARGKAQRDTEGRAHRMTGSLTDITERKLAEQALRDVGRRLIVAQEEERARLARELHDDVTQRMARLAIDAGRVEAESAGTSAAESMRGIRLGLSRLSADIHALSYRLHPAVLEDLGLREALRVECDRFSQRSSLPVRANLDDPPSGFPDEASLCLFRVAQQALQNVDRHARAHQVELTLRCLDGGVQLAVHDDGAGFDPERERARPSLGLPSMRERVHLVGGEIDIESAPGEGTTIVAWIPLGERRS